MIRSESVPNAPLILLHGGPGLSETRFLRPFNAPLEKSFTVVYWDQRGPGKSFHPDIPDVGPNARRRPRARASSQARAQSPPISREASGRLRPQVHAAPTLATSGTI